MKDIEDEYNANKAEERIMKAIIHNPKLFTEIIETLNNIIDTLTFQCDTDGIRLRALDRSHISFVELEITPDYDFFTEYMIHEPETIIIDTNEFSKILKRQRNGDTLTLETPDEYNLSILFTGEANRRFNIRQIDTDYDTPTPPSIDYPVQLPVPVTVINDFLTDISLQSENVQFTVDRDYLIAEGEGNNGAVECKYLHGEHIQECVSSKYNIGMIRPVVKGKQLGGELTLCIGDDLPLTLIRVDDTGTCQLSFLLAPRVETDE